MSISKRSGSRRGLLLAAAVCVLAVPAGSVPAKAGENGLRLRDPEEHLIVPRDYSPDKSWPLTVVYQNKVAAEQLADSPYFAAYGANPEMIMAAAGKYNFDPMRIYGTGFSRSGHGLLEQTWTYPHRFAAVVPLCEDLREKPQYGEFQKTLMLKYIQETPALLLHGDHDSFLKTGRKNYEYMKEHGCPVEWDTYPGGHTPAPIYNRNFKRVTDFFDKHRLNPWPRKIHHGVWNDGATRAFWVDARVAKRQPKSAPPEYRVEVKPGNLIEVGASADVRKLIFMLNGEVVDMAKPVRVVAGDRELYSGQATCPLEVKLSDGPCVDAPGGKPLWERLTEFYASPQESGAYDWLYVTMPTRFKDPRFETAFGRRVCIDLGFREVGSPEKAVIEAASRKFLELDVMQPTAELAADAAGLKRKLPVEVTVKSEAFGLQGVVEGGDTPVKLLPAGQGRSGEVILVRVRLVNRGKREIACAAELQRSVMARYNWGMYPKDADPAGFCAGIKEIAGTKIVSAQYVKHGNEAYQVFGFLMLNPGGLPPVKDLFVPGCPYNWGFYGVRRELVLKPGAEIELPLLLVSANPPDPKAAKPACPEVAKIVEAVRPELLRKLGEGAR